MMSKECFFGKRQVKLRRLFLAISACLLSFAAVGCGGGGVDADSGNALPAVQITQPANGSAFSAGDTIKFSASCTDAEDGHLTGAALVWTSDQDGPIGTGETFGFDTLSAGTHQVTLTATDSGGAVGTANITLAVIAVSNSRPVVQITNPASGSTFYTDQLIAFKGEGNDNEDGDLTGAALVWTSDLDGSIGSGGNFTFNALGIGTHQVTLTGTDSAGAKGTAVITLFIRSNASPKAQILVPSAGSTFNAGESIPFVGNCTDSEDGPLSGAALVWVSGQDGRIGSGESFSTTSLSAGRHHIAFSCSDSAGAVGTDTVAIDVNALPTVDFSSPADGSSFFALDLVTFIGKGTDAEDGSLLGDSLVWTSDVDGQIGTGRNFILGTLTQGTHLITITGTDSDGAEAIYSALITIIGQLPDTGQVRSYSNTFGEDSDYTIRPPTYTKLDADGKALPFSATEWVTVREDVTGLIWEVKSDISDFDDIHDIYQRFTWQEAQGLFIDQLNSDDYGGFSDWRLPTIVELQRLVEINFWPYQFNPDYFPGSSGPETPKTSYWSSTDDANDADRIWALDPQSGTAYGTAAESATISARAVRGGD